MTVPGSLAWRRHLEAHDRAVTDRDQAIRRAIQREVPARDIATAFGLTVGRVYQLAAEQNLDGIRK